MERSTPPVRLTRATILDVLRRTANKQAMIDNPNEFAVELVRILKEKLADQLVSGIIYLPTGEEYLMTQFVEEFDSYLDRLEDSPTALYDHVAYDSDIERDFVRELERRTDIKLYVKLPPWFTVQTPVGEYNPDWAIVREDRDEFGETKSTLVLVAETKGSTNEDDLRPDERRKVKCGRAHFEKALGTEYRLVKTAAEIG